MDRKKKIINFAIIAHIDSGKTTLSNKIAEMFGLGKTKLDSLQEESERSITIKSRTFRFETATHIFNLVDTPGHRDFAGQVESFLVAVENSVLVLDGTEGLQSQTMSKITKARELKNFIIPAINKIDLPNTNLEKCYKDLERINIDLNNLSLVSGKTGEGLLDLINMLVINGKSPMDLSDKNLRVLIIDSFYNQYYGIVLIIKVIEGILKKNDDLFFFSNKYKIKAHDIGFLVGDFLPQTEITSGDIGYIITKIKDPEFIVNGDTIVKNFNVEPLPTFIHKKCFVFCLFLLNDPNDFNFAYEAFEKIRLTDSSFTFQKEETTYSGKAFRCGFLGLLHMEIIQSRMFNEFNINLVPTFPIVEYKVQLKDNSFIFVSNPYNLPKDYQCIFEPECICQIYSELDYIGEIVEICKQKRATNIDIQQNDSVLITCNIPLTEIITNFSDLLQSCSNGYCNYNYNESGYRKVDLVISSVWVNGDMVKELTYFTIKQNQLKQASQLAGKLKESIEREQYEIRVQVKDGLAGKIIASESLSAYKRDVISHCSGGDITRKKKLLEEQKAGKKKLLKFGKVSLNKDAFFKIVKI